MRTAKRWQLAILTDAADWRCGYRTVSSRRRGAIPTTKSFAVRVHDNFVHHNQRYGSLGYGVVVKERAYALIARNVFDYNRHAIAAAGIPGIGYYAQSNLVLEHGGLNSDALNLHTHQFDVHGTEDCFKADKYCGPAGERFVFRYNTIMYDHGTAIKVRAKPSKGALAEFNVFKHPDEWGGLLDDAALVQNPPPTSPGTGISFPRTIRSARNGSKCWLPSGVTSTPTGRTTASSRPVRPGGTSAAGSAVGCI
jgi:hypothetical protein